MVENYKGTIDHVNIMTRHYRMCLMLANGFSDIAVARQLDMQESVVRRLKRSELAERTIAQISGKIN